jgi:CheY-like chemotaxis protein
MTDEPIRILLVEDNVGDVYLLRKALVAAALNFELTVIDDGGAALDFVRGEGKYADSPLPDLAVLDLNLPKNDGLQVLGAIRQNERFAKVPVVVISSMVLTQPLLKDLRVSRYIPKSADLDKVLQIGPVLKEIVMQNRAAR